MKAAAEGVPARAAALVGADLTDHGAVHGQDGMVVLGDLLRGGVDVMADEGAAAAVLGPVRAGAVDQVPAEEQGRAARDDDRDRFQLARKGVDVGVAVGEP